MDGARRWRRAIGWGALGLLAGASYAVGGMGPGRGLPKNWSITATRGYGALTTISGNAVSALCVECHSANPSAHVITTTLGEAETRYRGSHFVRNSLDGSAHLTTNLGRERVGPWPLTSTASKYGNFALLQSVTTTTGDLICESCHNLRQNLNPGLRLGGYDPATGDSELCQGCHTDITTNGRHHPLGITTTGRQGIRAFPITTATTDSVRYFGASANQVTCLTCHKVHDAQTAAGARVVRRGASQVPGSRLPGVQGGPVNVVYYAGRPATYKGSAVSYAVGQTANFDQNTGAANPSGAGVLRRQDLAPGRALTNADPLCDVCHTYNE